MNASEKKRDESKVKRKSREEAKEDENLAKRKIIQGGDIERNESNLFSNITLPSL